MQGNGRGYKNKMGKINKYTWIKESVQDIKYTKQFSNNVQQ